MKKLMFALMTLAVVLLITFAGKLSAKTTDACPMCAVQRGQQLVSAKCDMQKAHKSASNGVDLKCCCAKCSASNKSTAECRQACGLKTVN